jgi:ElaB/YqjD/DUF883 family membrane-anchored ribosome-binding protein
MPRTTLITSIIEKRRPLAQKIESVEAILKSLASVLCQLEDQRERLISRVDDANIAARLREVDFSRIGLSIVAELDVLAKLKARFSRQNLNLGVVGIARQGKSRLLRSLTGLSPDEIPDGEKGHCTGVRSTIYQNPNSETYGMVWFHTEQTFLDEAIGPYYEKLDLGNKPTSFQEFARTLPPLPSHKAADTNYQAMYNYLNLKYHANFGEYYRLLGKAPERILREKIREYVAQDTVSGDRTFFNYLAVQKVSIFCDFPNSEAGKIALVDMPGLGDTGVGAEEQLIEILGQEVDAVLFVRMPRSTGDDWLKYDIDLYNTAKKSLKDRLPIEKWSFIILNRTDASSTKGDNLAQCEFMKNSLAQTPIKVVEKIVANCADESETITKILDPVINHLVSHIEDLDKEYASFCQNKINQLQHQISNELDKARNAFKQTAATADQDEIFEELFENLWDEITGSLEELVTELRGEPEDEDSYFQDQVNAIIQVCKTDTGIPADEPNDPRNTAKRKIKRMRDAMGSYGRAYDQYLDEVRTHLTRHFLSLDDGLNRAIEEAKVRVAKVLIEQGRLGGLTEAKGTEFIKVMAEQLPENRNKLKRGFQIISSFELSFRGLIQPRIRKCLNDLTPDARAIPLSDSQSEEELQAEILENLQTLHDEAVDKCKEALENMLGEPTQAALAIVEEFVVQVLRAKGMKTEWRLLLLKEKSKVWPEQFGEAKGHDRNQQEWLNLVERAAGANQLNSMQFLN